MDLGKSGLDGVKEEEEETSHEPAIRTESSDGQLANTESVKTLDTGSEVPSTDKKSSSDRPDSKTDDCDIKPEMTVDVYPAGCNSDSGISMPPSPDSITEDCRNRTETLSDEEINELYLGNVSAKNRRRRGIFGTSMSRTNSEETSEYNGESPDRLKVPSTPERKVSSVSFDLDVPEDYSHLQRKKSNPGNGDGKHISFGGFEEDAKDEKKSEDTRRWSRVSFQSNASEASYGSTPRGVASHVRRDSIALAMNGIPVLEKPKRFTMFRGVKEVGEVTKNPNSVLERINWKDKETYKKYVIHIFVIFIFILSLVFVSLAWYYHHITEHAIASSQQIFFDPRLRVLTLSDPNGHDIIKAQLGQEIPSWQLPLHCPLIETGDQSKKECLWKRHAVLRVNHFYSPDKDIQCYNVSWESLNPKYVPYDCFDIGDVQWFGSSNLTYGSMPISGKFDYNSNEYSAGNEGVLQSAVEFYWITSNAVGLFVNNEIPTHVRWNTTREGQMCLIANFTVPFYDQDDKRLPRLNYTLCNGHDTLKTHTFMRNLHSDPEKLRMIDTKSLQDPHWSTVAEKKSRQITQADVENVARSVVKYGLNCSTIQIDGVWQSKLGNLEFDVSTFPNVTRMMEIVESSNCSISLEINPFFHFLSENYDYGVKNNFFVRDSGAYVPGLVHWQHGIASVLDVSNEKAHEWFVNSIKSINSNYKIDILRFTYGNSNWLPHRPHFNVINETPNAVRRLFTNLVYSTNPKLVIDNTAQTQNVASLLSVKASIITMGTKTCISDLIPKSLTLGILGYPFIMSDGFRSYHDKINLNAPNLPSKDLFIRWMQLSAFFPATSYSLSPWSFDDETVKVSKNASVLHETLIMPIIKSRKMMQDLHRGLSIMRPLWMANAGDSTAKSISDQFLIGDTLLVAPIVCESTVKRDIYIPAGIWNDQLRSTLVVGPKWLHDYHASLFEIPHFVFMRVYN